MKNQSFLIAIMLLPTYQTLPLCERDSELVRMVIRDYVDKIEQAEQDTLDSKIRPFFDVKNPYHLAPLIAQAKDKATLIGNFNYDLDADAKLSALVSPEQKEYYNKGRSMIQAIRAFFKKRWNQTQNPALLVCAHKLLQDAQAPCLDIYTFAPIFWECVKAERSYLLEENEGLLDEAAAINALFEEFFTQPPTPVELERRREHAKQVERLLIMLETELLR